jgi:hypothetical protein
LQTQQVARKRIVARKTATEAVMMYLMILLPKFRPDGPVNPPTIATSCSRASRVPASKPEKNICSDAGYSRQAGMEPNFRRRPQTTDFADVVR